LHKYMKWKIFLLKGHLRQEAQWRGDRSL
jgi:hypothetical protein